MVSNIFLFKEVFDNFYRSKSICLKHNLFWFHPKQHFIAVILPPLVGMVLGMFCQIFAVFGKQVSCPFHPCAFCSSVKQHYFGDVELIFCMKTVLFLGIKNFYQQQIMLITNLKKGYNSTFESPAHALPCTMLAKFSSNNSYHSCIRYVLCVIILFLMWVNFSDRVLEKPMVGDQLIVTLQDFGIWLWSRYVPITFHVFVSEYSYTL